MASPTEYYRTHRLTVIGTGAVVVAALFAYLQLRRTPPASAVLAAASQGTPDLSAYTAGAAAASSGFDTGAALGQEALGLAGSVVGSQAGVASTLAASQAQVASSATADLSAALQAAFAAQSQPALQQPITLQLPANYGQTPAAMVPSSSAINPNLAQISTLNAAEQKLLGYIRTNRSAGNAAALATDLATYTRQYQQILALGGTPTTPAPGTF